MQHTSAIPDQINDNLIAVLQPDFLGIDDILFSFGSLVIECGGIAFLFFRKSMGKEICFLSPAFNMLTYQSEPERRATTAYFPFLPPGSEFRPIRSE